MPRTIARFMVRQTMFDVWVARLPMSEQKTFRRYFPVWLGVSTAGHNARVKVGSRFIGLIWVPPWSWFEKRLSRARPDAA